ncbi:type I polyketide synthase [Streptomyces sp. NBC_00536]|uniref:type I polyketide synthase n=1 Tax=Streptomyces sp. NBC_00536 TaxID=2975769 RepID=UPI002E8222FD|nr:type I polyketide synthase [Streptomyces sp. NBC_00536]WUC83204.1 type I polyketide synthase [Streptomyces sp. NBC_00536]
MSASQEMPIAVVGIGCRFPGGVETPGGLWQLAADGRQAAGPVPADRWDAGRLAAVHDPELAARAGLGCFLEGDVWAWDPQAFSVAPAERDWVDPQFRVLMETAWEAVEHAGIPVDRIRGSRTGVYVGTYAPDNLFREARPVTDAPNSPYLFGNFTAGAAGRVAFGMDLRGPVMVISTHCSSGLVALDTACGALTLGECDMALAGGVLLMLAPETQYYEAPLLLSPSGACHAFDARADGYVRGEGAGVLALKRLADARRDGDRVLAVIRGSAVNNDGQASRLTAPSTLMQQQLFREAVSKAGIDPGEVGLVEAHGPGTAVGDPIEYTSINTVYGQGRGRCALGSVKTNIGHSEPVSGIAGVIKAIECLRRGVIPPNRNFHAWNPAIERDDDSRLFVPTSLTKWPVSGAARLAAVCSYGVTGTNAHVVLEASATVRRRPARTAPRAESGVRLFLVSGTSPQSLTRAAARLSAWAATEATGARARDVAHTLAVRRQHADHRLGIVARDLQQLAARANAFAEHGPGEGMASGVPVLPPGHAGPVFVFTGQGSQRPGMCRVLLAGEPVFAAVIDELEPLIRAEAGFSLRETIEQSWELTGIDRIQPVLFGVQVALAALWKSWGVNPAAVVGQSLGEVAAAVVAGVLNAEDGVKVICRRSALLATISGGSMASVMLSAGHVRAAIEAAGANEVSIGVLTSPQATVVSGDAAQVKTLVEGWEAAGVVARMIDVDVASHSSQVTPILDELHHVLADVPATVPGPGFFSTVSDDPRDPGPLDADYWVRNQRHAVRFHTAVSAALDAGHRLFIECTAHPLAVRPILDTATHHGITDAVAVGTLRQGTDDQEAFLEHLATVHCSGHDQIDFAAHYGQGELADVPTTAWHRTRHGGTQTPYTLVGPHLTAASQHPLLGGHVKDPEHPEQHLWQTPISPGRLPWLGDHQVAGVPVLPGTGFAEMILAAGAEVFGTHRIALEHLSAEAPLVLEPEPAVTTRLILSGEREAAVTICSGSGEEAVVHARATVRPLPDDATATSCAALPVPAGDWVDAAPADLYRHFRERHDVVHGPAFTAIDRIQIHPTDDVATSRLHIADSARVSAHTLRLHPALADELVQTVVSVWLAHHATSPGPVVVAGFDEIHLYGPTAHTRLAAVEIHHADDLTCAASGRLATADGTVVAEVRGLRLTNITPAEQRYTARLSHLAWLPEPPAQAPQASDQQWLVITPDDMVWGERLGRLLGKKAAGSRRFTPPRDRPLDIQHLAQALDSEAEPPCTHVLLALGGHQGAPTPGGARAAVQHTLTVLTHLAERETPPRLWVLWRGDDVLAAAGVRGLLRTAAFEHPELRPSSLEVAGDTPLEAILPDLLADDPPITEIAWRHGTRYLARVQPGPGPGPTTSDGLPRQVRADGSYLITGGLGGLGLLTARRLAERGARRLVLCGRSAPTPAAARELDDLRTTTGCAIEVVLGDIADTTAQALKTATDGDTPLRGIVHAAGVVEDATLANLDPDLLERVWRGKAEGAWALHQATLDADLDFFVVYSSLASLIGSPGQGAYAAANAYLDALTAHRLAEGLPATGIHWGAFSQVGRGQHLAQQGFVLINPTDGMDALERILAEGHHQIAYSPIDPAQWTAPYPALRHSTLLAHLLTDTPAADHGASPVRDEVLSAGSDAERRRILEDFITGQVRELLGNTTRHIGAHTSMVVLGMDSLGAVQLQQRIHRALKVDIKPGVIWVKPTAASLADWLLAAMGLTGSEKVRP